MFIMLTVASLCAVSLSACLLALVCRHRETMWIASDDAILCIVTPVMILVATFGFISLGWRLTHGGFAAVSVTGWVGSAIIVAISLGIWFLLAPRIRGSRRNPTAAALSPFDSKQVPT